MPYASDAQRRYFNANRRKLEHQGVSVDEWNDASRGMKLPERKAGGGNVQMSGGLPLTDPMVNFDTPQRPLPWGPDAFRGPGGLPMARSQEGGEQTFGDQVDFNYWAPAFWPPGMQAPDAPDPTGNADNDQREEFTYPTETLPQAEPPPVPDFLNHSGHQALPSGQFMPGRAWIPPIRQMEREGYDAGGSIAGIPFGGGSGGQPMLTAEQLQQQFPMAQSMWGNPELLRPLTQMLENIQSPGEIGPAEELRGMSQFPFQNLGRSFGLTPLSSGQVWQMMMDQGYSDPGTGAQNIYDYIMQDPGNSNRIWEYLDPRAPVDMGQPAPTPAPTPEPTPEPTPAPAPTPRREYTYPTETLPVAEPPPPPSFLGGSGRGRTWIPPIQPMQDGQLYGSNRHQRGGHIRARRGYANGGMIAGMPFGQQEQAPMPEPASVPLPRPPDPQPDIMGGGGMGGPLAANHPGMSLYRMPFAGGQPGLGLNGGMGGMGGRGRGYAEGGNVLDALSAQGNLQPGTFLPVSEVGMHPGWGNDNAGFRYGDANARSGPNLYHMPEGMEQVWPDTLGQHEGEELGWTPVSAKKWQLAARPGSPPTPEPEPLPPPPEPEPEPPRQEYTYPTETLPVAEPPSDPGFTNEGNGGGRWLPPVQPIGGNTFQWLPQHRKGGRVSQEEINRARLRAVVSAKRGDR